MREKRHRVFNGLAGKSKTSTGWFFGLKLHLVINNLCEIVNLRVTRGNTDDRTPLPELCNALKGMIFGDRGYVSKDKTELLSKQGLKLITTLKKNKFILIVITNQPELSRGGLFKYSSIF